MDSQTGTGGYDVNITYSSDYMSSGGEINVKWRAESGCSTTSSSDIILVVNSMFMLLILTVTE